VTNNAIFVSAVAVNLHFKLHDSFCINSIEINYTIFLFQSNNFNLKIKLSRLRTVNGNNQLQCVFSNICFFVGTFYKKAVTNATTSFSPVLKQG